MRVELRLTDSEDAHIIKNLWPLYLHDISEFDGSMPNRHGIFGGADGVTTLAKQAEAQRGWWVHPQSVFPYVILADGRPAGFHLIASSAILSDEIEADFVVHEFFVLHPFRGKGVAERAAIEGLDRHRGTWEIVTYPNHARAIAFWRRALRKYLPDGITESERDHPWGRKVTFCFDNTQGS